MATKTIANSATIIVPANASRKSLALLNEDTTDSVYIKREEGESLSVSSTDHDWKLLPGAAIAFNSQVDGIKAIRARYTAVSSANTPRISFFESEDIDR